MTRKTRFLLLLVLTILFCFIAPSVILYSQGYRFDFERKKITQTGAFYFKVWPKNVEIYINDQFKKQTDFLFGEALLKNLLPKKYKVKIKKAGFQPWEKTLEIKENYVTEAKNIILFPENPRFELLENQSFNFSEPAERISPDLKKTFEFSDYEIWILFLEDDLSVFHHKGDKIFLTRFSEKIGEVFWLNSHYLIFNVGGQIKIAEIDDRDRINIYDIAKFPDCKIFWNKDEKKIYLLSEGNFFVSEKLLP